MQKLHLVGFTTDHEGLILSARRGARSGSYLLQIDGALEEAVDERRARREEEPEAEDTATSARRSRVESALPVREIQARLRQGRTIAEVARAAGVDADWVERFAPPVLAERAKVIEQVRSVPLRRARLGASVLPIGEAVRRNLADRGVSQTPDEFNAAWTARQVADGRWAVRYAYHHRGHDQTLRFDLDEASGEVSTADRTSGQLGYVAPRSSTPTATSGERRPAKPVPEERPVVKRAVVSTGYRPDPEAQPVSRSAKERERAAVAMRKAAAKRAIEGEKAAARKLRERREAAARKEREERAAAARAAREAAAAQRAAEASARAKKAAAKKAAAERAAAKAAAPKPKAQPPRSKPATRPAPARRAAASKATRPAAKKAAKTPSTTKRPAKAVARKGAQPATTATAARAAAKVVATTRVTPPAPARAPAPASAARPTPTKRTTPTKRATPTKQVAPRRPPEKRAAPRTSEPMPRATPSSSGLRSVSTTPAAAVPPRPVVREPALPSIDDGPAVRILDRPVTDGARLTGAAENVYGTESARAMFRRGLVEQASGDVPVTPAVRRPRPSPRPNGLDRPRRTRPLRAT